MVLINKREYCKECGGKLIDTGTDMVCRFCGLVNARIYHQPNYQVIKTAKSFGSVYASAGDISVKGDRLGTRIGKFNERYMADFSGKPINSDSKEKYYRYKKIQDYYVASEDNDRTYRATRMLNSVIGTLELPEKVKLSAYFIYSKINQEKIPKIRMIDMVSAAIYLAIRTQTYNLRIKELLESIESLGYKITGRQVLAAAAIIKRETKLRVRNVRPENYIERVISNLANDYNLQKKLNKNLIDKNIYIQSLRKLTKELLENLSDEERGGRDPFALACACVVGADVIIGRYNKRRRGYITQRTLARINNVAEFTLREHYLTIVKPILGKIVLTF